MKGYLLKHKKPTRIFHGIHLVLFILLLCSGLAVFSKDLRFLSAIFGGLKNAASLHKYLGFAYFITPLLYMIFYFDLFKKYIAILVKFDSDDKKWLAVGGGYLAPLIKGEAPPQGKYNAGQKMLAWVIMALSCVMASTGLIMIYYTSFPAGLVGWAYLIHALSGIFLGCGVIVHFYLAAVNPSSRHELNTMIGDGQIEEEYAKQHNVKWYKDMTAKS
jgi:formate dehydrogenase gamma subunit